MNKQIKLTIGIGLIVLLLAAGFAAAAFAQGPMGQNGFGGMMGGYNGGTGRYGGMMQGWLTGQTTNSISGTLPFGMGGMMGGLGGTTGCPGAAGAWGNPGNAQPIAFDEAVEAVQDFLKSYNNSDLTVAEVMEFQNNFYAIIKEKSTGMGAFELLINRYTGVVTPEPGPNMMWNTQYGHMAGFGGMMGGMMGGGWNRQTGPMSVSTEQARATAQAWLDANFSGARLADHEMQFSGYYTMDFLKDGETVGMLSVNGYTGQVWYHTWHGEFISEREF